MLYSVCVLLKTLLFAHKVWFKTWNSYVYIYVHVYIFLKMSVMALKVGVIIDKYVASHLRYK